MMRKIAALALAAVLFFSSSLSTFEPIPIRSDYHFTLITPGPVLHDANKIATRVFPTPTPIPTPPPTPRPTKKPAITGWIYDPEVSWYGPGFYGGKTACGQAYTTAIMGVAHRSLPCGTLVSFMWKGKVETVPVIDRGPFVAGRIWDLSGALCVELDHCFTGPIYYKIGN